MSKQKGSAFVKDAAEPKMDPTTFNLRRWIDRGKARVVKYAEVYMAAGLEADIRELDAQILAAKGSMIDDRFAGSSNGTVELRRMAEEVEALRAEMESSKTIFKFRGLEPGEFDKIKGEAPDGDDEDESLIYRLFAAQCIQPSGLTADDFEAIAGALGEGYFMQTIGRAAIAARDGSSIDVPFSHNTSAILRTVPSSEN